MDISRLIAMANDIAAFFDSEPDKAVAAEGVRFHISRFWEPRMRREIVAHLQGGGAGHAATARHHQHTAEVALVTVFRPRRQKGHPADLFRGWLWRSHGSYPVVRSEGDGVQLLYELGWKIAQRLRSHQSTAAVSSCSHSPR